jgi:hypothetical protein
LYHGLAKAPVAQVAMLEEKLKTPNTVSGKHGSGMIQTHNSMWFNTMQQLVASWTMITKRVIIYGP